MKQRGKFWVNPSSSGITYGPVMAKDINIPESLLKADDTTDYSYGIDFYRGATQGCCDMVAEAIAHPYMHDGTGNPMGKVGFEVFGHRTPMDAVYAGISYANSQIQKYGYGWSTDVKKNGFLDIYNKDGVALFNIHLDRQPCKDREYTDDDASKPAVHTRDRKPSQTVFNSIPKIEKPISESDIDRDF